MKIEYKTATVADIPTLIAIEQTVAGNKNYSPTLDGGEWKDALTKERVYLLEKGGELVGSASYEIRSDGTVYISGLVVVPKFQGKGIGRDVMHKILADVSGAKRIELVTHPDNAVALRLYEQLGFSIESRKENYYDDGEPRLILALERR